MESTEKKQEKWNKEGRECRESEWMRSLANEAAHGGEQGGKKEGAGKRAARQHTRRPRRRVERDAECAHL